MTSLPLARQICQQQDIVLQLLPGRPGNVLVDLNYVHVGIGPVVTSLNTALRAKPCDETELALQVNDGIVLMVLQ